MPGSINDFNHGNFAASQASVGGGGAVGTPNVSLAQSGGSRRMKGMRRRKGMSGGLVPLSPSELGDTTGGQTGGYLASVFKAAIAPLGLMGLKKYAQDSRRGKSRLSKKLRSRRHNRHY
jgi:hypothetical protein